MEKIKIIGIYGAGGCGRGIAPLLKKKFKNSVKIIFIDDNKQNLIIDNCECLNFEKFLKFKQKKKIILAIADSKKRKLVYKKIKKYNLEIFSYFDQNAINFGNNDIEDGYLISPFVTIATNVKIGKQFHGNLYSYVEHDCIIGDFVTFAPGAKCNGNVRIGDNVFLGCGSIIKNGTPHKPIKIGSNVIIGAGAVVTKDIKKDTVVIGNPAKKLK